MVQLQCILIIGRIMSGSYSGRANRLDWSKYYILRKAKKMKKILSFIMAAMMVVMMLPAVVSADTTYVAAIGETKYETLIAAYNAAAKSGDTIKLLADCEGIGITFRKSVTIDFNGHTYTVTIPVGSNGSETQGFRINNTKALTDPITVTLKNGTLKADNSKRAEGEKKILWLVNCYDNLNLIDMVLDGTGLYDSKNPNYVMSINNGNVVIKGDTDIIASEGDIAFDAYGHKWYNGVVVNVDTTGKIIGEVLLDEAVKGADIIIKNGVFSDADVEEYLAEELVDDHMTLVKGADGLYTIQCAHSFGEWERDGYKNVRECEYCGKPEVKALTSAQIAADQVKNYVKSRSTVPYAVAIDADETVVITNNTSKNRTIKDLGDSALYGFMTDVKYSFAAVEGYEIVSVTVDGVEVKDPANVKIFQIKKNSVIKVVTAAVEAEEAAE